MFERASLQRDLAVGRFIVEDFLGAGGMGELYAARDVQLGRRVALKILPLSRSADSDRVERFVREARAASSLNHPAIVTIFDSGTATLAGETVHYLAMELIDGETLTAWTRGGRNRHKLLSVLAQAAEGLARAHAGGIVHRDLKPDNIMVARGGYAKIVDFGIAKLTEPATAQSNAGETAPAGRLGTTAFMSPEQVEGRSIDHRSDVFSFGSVLYAAYTGRSPFERDSAVKTMHAIVNDAPPPLAGATPQIERIARRCLAKDPDERYQSMKDLALDLRDFGGAPASPPSRAARPALISALAASIIIATAAWIAAGRQNAPRKANPREASPPPMSMVRLTTSGTIVTGAASPDGKYVVYAIADRDDQSIWMRQIATGTDVRIVPASPVFYSDVQVSPDGNYVFYSYAPRDNPNVADLYQIPILGGAPRRVVHDLENRFSISPDGRRIAFRRFSAADRYSNLLVADIESGNELVVFQRRYPEGFGDPAWSPDGKRLTFIFGSQMGAGRANIVDLDLATGRITRIPSPPWPGFGGITWVPDGSGIVLTVAERQQPPQLWYLPVNDGPPRKITSDVAFYGGVTFTSESKSFVANRSEESANVWVVDLSTGRTRALTSGVSNTNGANGVQWLPSGEILYTAPGIGPQRVRWRILDPGTGSSRDVPNASGWWPKVSPDGTKIAYFSATNAAPLVWICDVDGENARQITREPVYPGLLSWLPDSRSLIYVESAEHQAAWRVNLDDGQRMRLTDRPANTPQVSNDGKWLVCRYRAAEPGKPLWRTALLPMDRKAPPKYFDIPHGGGPHIFEWLPDGHTFAFVDFVNGVGNIFVQDIRGGAPRQVTRFDSGQVLAYDFSSDAKSIVVAHGEAVRDLVLIRDFR